MTQRQAIIVIDLGYGDAGKGTITDFLVREHNAHTVVRFNGGSQAAHNVITSDGRHHTFSQFGSGTFAGAWTYLSRYMLVNPIELMYEAEALENLGIKDPLSKMVIDGDAWLTTPFHVAANRLKELQRGDTFIHGSCGKGIGETMVYFHEFGNSVPFVRDMLDPYTLKKSLRFLQQQVYNKLRSTIEWAEQLDESDLKSACMKEVEAIVEPATIDFFLEKCSRLCETSVRFDQHEGKLLARQLIEPGTVIFEGAQGVLLDEWYGFHPYATYSTTTQENALTLLDECEYDGQVSVVGVCRSFTTRHGPGPLVTEDATLTAKAEELHNATNPWQRHFRSGWFDFVAMKYALEVTSQLSHGVDMLAVTCMDIFSRSEQWWTCASYGADITVEMADALFIQDQEKRMIKGIRVKQDKEDIIYQKALAMVLEGCWPHIQRCTQMCPESYLSFISENLGLPVRITSFGPRSDQKEFLP